MADIQVGLAIRLVRAKRKLSQNQVAQRMGTARNYISRVECEEFCPNMTQFVRIADALEVEPDKLLRFARRLQRDAEAAPDLVLVNRGT